MIASLRCESRGFKSRLNCHSILTLNRTRLDCAPASMMPPMACRYLRARRSPLSLLPICIMQMVLSRISMRRFVDYLRKQIASMLASLLLNRT
jgi:hypothetical protein